MRLIYLEAIEKVTTLLGLTTELKNNFYEIEIIYNLVFIDQVSNDSIEGIEKIWKNFPSDFQFLHNIYEISKNYESLEMERGFINHIFKDVSVPFLSFYSDLVFRVLINLLYFI